jgi:hypothetical protein
MAMLATLEGDEKTGISLNDLFNVNDYLGVKFFGPEDWNKVKKCVCAITAKASENPTLFYIDSLKEDYPNYKESTLSKCVFGFNDRAGCELMGSIPWNRLKVKIDNELLGWNPVSSIKSGAKKVVSGAKAVATAPVKALDYVTGETPLKYLPVSYLYQKAENYLYDPARSKTGSLAQKVKDLNSKLIQTTVKEVPGLKYTPIGKMALEVEKAKEEVGITSKGTAGVYETDEEKIEKQKKAAAAAARAASAASATRTAGVEAAQQKQALATAAAAAQQQQQQTQADLDVMEARATSKYAPIVMIGCFGLLALALLKK